jgi:hypothetical protein
MDATILTLQPIYLFSTGTFSLFQLEIAITAFVTVCLALCFTNISLLQEFGCTQNSSFCCDNNMPS